MSDETALDEITLDDIDAVNEVYDKVPGEITEADRMKIIKLSRRERALWIVKSDKKDVEK